MFSDMSLVEVESYGMTIGLTLLIGLMVFIVYDLARHSKGGKWAYIALFGGLCFGIFGFVAKYIITMSLDMGY